MFNISLPSWASRFSNNYEVGSMLATLDGRKIGNAVIINITKNNLGLFYQCKTDIGNIITCTSGELSEYFYPPQFISRDYDETIKNK